MSSRPQVRLVAATVPLLDALEEDPALFGTLIGSPVPDGWPEFPEAVGFTRQHLLTAPEPDRRWSMQFFVDAATGRLIGSGGFAAPPVDRTVEIGYEVAPEFRGRGFGTAAAGALLERAVAGGEVDHVVAHTLPGPNPSTGVLVSLGFEHVADREDPEVGTVREWRWSAGRARRAPRPRTAVRRLPEKQVDDRAALDDLLDAALVAHVAVVDGGQPYAVPLGLVRDGDRVLVHGSTASRAFRLLATGAPSCTTVTIVDGVVVARSRFESSMRYRSAMILGSYEALDGEAAEAALEVLSARLLPGLTGARPPSVRELRATSVLALPLNEWSLKVSAGFPEDGPEDLDLPVWAGVVPLRHVWGEPESAPDLMPGIPVPEALRGWTPGRA